jgi:HAMP domain-containing protein
LYISTWGLIRFLRKKEDFKRTLNLTFLQVTMPKKDSQMDEKNDTAKDFKEMVSVMEQLFSSLKSIYSAKILKKILGQDILSFEYVAHE